MENKRSYMNKRTAIVMTCAVLGAQIVRAQPNPAEFHQRVVDHLKTVRDVFVPAPIVHFVETFPPIAVPRAHILQLAQADPVPFEDPVPPPVDPIDAGGIAT